MRFRDSQKLELRPSCSVTLWSVLKLGGGEPLLSFKAEVLSHSTSLYVSRICSKNTFSWACNLVPS